MNESSARPAEPLLAAQLLGDEELDELLEDACSIGEKRKRRNKEKLLDTGVKSLDRALDGGLEVGKVVSISCEAGAGGSELCRTLLVRSLFQFANSSAAVIDTSGNFDILRLYTLILSHLRRNPDLLSSLLPLAGAAATTTTSTESKEPKIEDVAAMMLDRVKIMRVFDFVGVREAIGEIRDALEGRGIASASSRTQENKGKEQHVVHEKKEPAVEIPPQPPRRTVVADSEDEDEEEDEMLFEAEVPAPAVQEQDDVVQHSEAETMKQQNQNQKDIGDNNDVNRMKFILIDNLASVINPLLKKDYIQANALASTFLTTLTNLSHTHNLHTIILNPTTTPRSPSTQPQPQAEIPNQAPPPTAPSAPQLYPQRPHHHRPPPPQPPSIFASNTAIPNLLNILGRHTDLGLLVTRVPRRKIDARVFYSSDAVGGVGEKSRRSVRHGRGPEMVGVVEVVRDRWEGRVGEWGAFVEGEREGEGLRDVG